jgi:hypothetical protein
LRAVAKFLFKLLNSPFKTGKYLISFLTDMGQLAIRQVWHISHEDFSVIPKG